jgi:hypothetical protein
MKFMVNWEIHPDKRVDVITMWSGMTPKERADLGPGLKLIGRWHNLAEYTGVAIFEATDAAALSAYIGRWNPVMDIDIGPVLDDEESAATGKVIVAQLASR